MQVLVLGLCRTGTKSLQSALRELGYRETYHMGSALYENPLDCDLWLEAIAAKFDGRGQFTRENWDGLLGHCMAVTDLPCAAFAPELISAYPEAKVILSNRNVESWYRSCCETVHPFTVSWVGWLLSRLDADSQRTYTMTYTLWDRLFAGDFPKNGKKVFEEHYDTVRRVMADRPQDLLEYEVKGGWDPLCTFLGKQVPERPFPRSNDIQGFNRWMGSIRRQQWMRLSKNLVLVVAGVTVGVASVIWATTGRDRKTRPVLASSGS